MRTVSIFRSKGSQTIRIPSDMEFQGVSELELIREGDTLILRAARPSWGSLRNVAPASADFLTERQDVVAADHTLHDFK